LRRLRDIEIEPVPDNGDAADLPTVDERTSVRDALSLMVTHRVTALVVVDEAGERRGMVGMETLAHFADAQEAKA
jgi:CBS domain-containing protein